MIFCIYVRVCCQEHYNLMLLFVNFLFLGQQNLEPVRTQCCP